MSGPSSGEPLRDIHFQRDVEDTTPYYDDDDDDGPKVPFISESEVLENGDLGLERPRYRRRSSWWKFSMPLRKRWNSIRVDGLDGEGDTVRTGVYKVPFFARSLGWKRRLFFGAAVVVLAIFGLIHVFNFIIGLGPLFWDDGYEYWLGRWGQDGESGEGLSKYPTDFTRDILPIPCHSHNDYWRRIPLFEAIHFGCTGVEADVWLFDEDLFVGHDTASLSRNRTFRSLYVDPLVKLLDKQNPQTDFSNGTHAGVFDEDPDQTLVLLVDFKTSGSALWPYVYEQLSALREKNYLTYYNGKVTVPGPITVVATGNAPFDLVVANSTYRDIFFDAPLGDLWEDPDGNYDDGPVVAHFPTKPNPRTPLHPIRDEGQGHSGTDANTHFDNSNSFYASVSFSGSIGMMFRGRLSEKQIYRIRGQIKGAHKRGLKARYWSTPSWPISLRNHVWEILIREGADYLNVDDLRGAARTDWRRNRRGGHHH